MNGSGSESLPLEVWQQIAALFDKKSDFLKLRSVCRSFRDIFTPFVISSIVIAISPTLLSNIAGDIYSSDARKCPFAPVPETFIDYITTLHIDLDYDETHLPTPSLLAALWDELPRLCAIRQLRISCLLIDWRQTRYSRNTNATPVVDRILDSVLTATNGFLTSLDINLDQATEIDSLVTLGEIHGLEEIFLQHRCCELERLPRTDPLSPGPYLSFLYSILLKNASVKTLNYSRFDTDILNPISIPLSDVFLPEIDSMNFETLHLFSNFLPASIDQPPLNMPRLSHLQYLYICQAVPSPCVNIDQLWLCLRVSRAVLRSLNTHYISAELLNYLASYSGLEDCTLDLRQPVDYHDIPSLTVRQAFSPHGTTLEYLNISDGEDRLPNGFEGFSFLPTPWMDPSLFPVLRKLTVPCYSDVELTEQRFTSLLEILSEFPALHSVFIRWHGTELADTGDLQKGFFTRTRRPHMVTIEHDPNDMGIETASCFTNLVSFEEMEYEVE